jgi:hypothetical protein
MLKRILLSILSAFTGISALVFWFLRGTFEAWFFDKVIQTAPTPNWSWIIEYGPPAVFAALTIWLIWWAKHVPPVPELSSAEPSDADEKAPLETEEAARKAAGDSATPFDVMEWANQRNYFVWVAACLWVERRPTSDIPASSPAYRPLQLIKADLVAQVAKSLDGHTTASARVSIQELRKIAKRAREQPRFLFPPRGAKKSGKPEPNMHLEEVVRRIIRRDRLPLPTEEGSNDLIYACNQIREKALNDQIVIFGCAEWRSTQPKDYDHMVRSRIPAEYWKDHKIDAADSFGTDQIFRRGITSKITGGWDQTEYLWLWFDRSQVTAQWPG